MNRHVCVAALLGTAVLASCDKNAVQVIPTEPPLASRIKFFNFGVGAPAVNFYANETKMTAILSGTGAESNNGVAYGSAAAGGVYESIAPGLYTLTGRIAVATNKNLLLRLEGRNPKGKLLLDEYTRDKLTARVELTAPTKPKAAASR